MYGGRRIVPITMSGGSDLTSDIYIGSESVIDRVGQATEGAILSITSLKIAYSVRLL